MEDNKIISVSSRKKCPNLEDFEKLMLATQDKFNNISQQNPKAFFKLGASLLEQETTKLIRSVCDGTIFLPEDVTLISGHAFPDIQASSHFGVEVKSTEKDAWTSTGSSIVESTRIQNIEYIYMLFGKLGSNPPEFKVRPYQSVLKGINVTHSPRYSIDMTLGEGETIFDQMGISYDDFRLDANKIDRVRDFYRKKNANNSKNVAPQWWLGKDSPVNIEIMRQGFDSERKHELIAEMLLLFDELILGEYGEAAVWLCTRKFIINPSFRDLFSAGGQIVEVNGKKLKNPYPHIVGCILEHIPYIKVLIDRQDEGLLADIRTHWGKKVKSEDIFDKWVNRMRKAFSQSRRLKNINIHQLIMEEPDFKYSN